MSLVGPKPHALAHDVQYTNPIANYPYRHPEKRICPHILLHTWAQGSSLAACSEPLLRNDYNAIYGVVYAQVILRSDVFHLHGIGPALIAPIAKALGMKVIVTHHSKNYERQKWKLIARVYFTH